MIPKKNKPEKVIRSSVVEYLTRVAATGKSAMNAVYADHNVWLTQKMIGVLYDVDVSTVNYHLQKCLANGELEGSVIRNFRITDSDGKTHDTRHYNLTAIIAVGNKVDSPKAVQFRKWANAALEEFMIKGFTMDDERLKNFGTFLTPEYFEEQLEKIREIRLSSRDFYQKITDIYATSIDYDSSASETHQLFSRVLRQRYEMIAAQKYLTQEGLSSMDRIVSAYLDLAEFLTKEQIPLTMRDWACQFEEVLKLSPKEFFDTTEKMITAIVQKQSLCEYECGICRSNHADVCKEDNGSWRK